MRTLVAACLMLALTARAEAAGRPAKRAEALLHHAVGRERTHFEFDVVRTQIARKQDRRKLGAGDGQDIEFEAIGLLKFLGQLLLLLAEFRGRKQRAACCHSHAKVVSLSFASGTRLAI